MEAPQFSFECLVLSFAKFVGFSLTEGGEIGIDSNSKACARLAGHLWLWFHWSERISCIIMNRGGDIMRGMEFRGELCVSKASILQFN
jgi:hypothetical protein